MQNHIESFKNWERRGKMGKMKYVHHVQTIIEVVFCICGGNSLRAPYLPKMEFMRKP